MGSASKTAQGHYPFETLTQAILIQMDRQTTHQWRLPWDYYEKDVDTETPSRLFIWLYSFPLSAGADDPPRIINGPLSFLPLPHKTGVWRVCLLCDSRTASGGC